MTDVEMVKVEVKPNPKNTLKEEWTIEEGPSVSVMGSGAFEVIAPDFYKKVCKIVGDDCWFSGKVGDGPSVIATGDPMDEDTWTIIKIPNEQKRTRRSSGRPKRRNRKQQDK
jgi:hypothetical protein